MKYSNNYIIYSNNRALERAIAGTLGLLSEEFLEAATPDSSVTVADVFLNTRGNYEQRSFSTNVFEDLRDVLEGSLTEEYRQQEPLAWAETQNRLGNILAAIGQQHSDADSFEKAIQCFKHALAEVSQEESPPEWAETQYNLGTASQALGRLQKDTKRVNAAVEAYTNALLVWSRENSPEEWMTTMCQLGSTFHTYGILLKGNRNLQKSIVAYKNALAELNADDYALELTATHNNRGAVLHHLAESEENPDRVLEAIKSYEKALTVCMEQQLPFHLAVICRVNKATAQNVLAQLTNDAMLAQEVADEFELILACFPHALQPLCVKHCEEQLSKAQSLS